MSENLDTVALKISRHCSRVGDEASVSGKSIERCRTRQGSKLAKSSSIESIGHPSTPILTRRAGVRTWIELDARAAGRNVLAFRRLIGPRVKLWAVVKSNAYGHGLFAFTPLAAELGVDGFCVDSLVEAKALRRAGIRQSILVLGHTLPERFPEAVAGHIALTASNFETLEELARAPAAPEFHLKFDTGMRRQGFFPSDTPRLLRRLKARPALRPRLTGLYTHFAAANDLDDPGFTQAQMREFLRTTAQFARAGYGHLLRHAAATGGTMLGPQYHLDAVRIGIGLYGLWPSPRLARQFQGKLQLEPVLAWRAVVSEVKWLAPGDAVGYDLTERVPERTKMAVVPIGYWHGFPRALSGIGEVLLHGRRARVLGRVSMDLISIAPAGRARPGDIVTLIGRDRGATIGADESAQRAGTIHYEFLTRLNPLMERVVV